MNKKILIGSIISIAILVGVSFTSVVGYSSVKSTSGEASPLFNIRTNRAINQESEGLTCDYVGKGETKDLIFTKKDYNNSLLFQLIDKLNNMNDNFFNKVLNRYIKKISENYKLSEDELSSVIYNLNFIRNYPNLVKGLIVSNNIWPLDPTWNDEDWFPLKCIGDFLTKITVKHYCTYFGLWFPTCFFINYMEFLLVLCYVLMISCILNITFN